MQKKLTYQEIQKFEAESWIFSNKEGTKEEIREAIRAKIEREKIRYPMMIRQMNLHNLDTSNMVVFDIGCSITGGVSSFLPSKQTLRIDPLKEEYGKYVNVDSFINTQAENLKDKLSEANLVLVTNALDHFENPTQFLYDLVKYMQYGAFFCHFHALDNKFTHEHPCHQFNVNPKMFDEILSTHFEKVWGLDYNNDGLRYGWVQYNGKVGQPAFCGLYRKTK